MLRDRLRNGLREPLVHFVAAGLALFGASEWRGDVEDRSQIVMTPQREARLATRYAMQFGSPPDTATLARLVEHDIEEEILFRRGIELGLDQDDEIVRRRVVQKMQFLLQDVNAPSEPSEAELDAYFASHASRYATPARVTFRHVYFSTEEGDEATRARANDALTRIAAGVGTASLGDPFPDLYHFSAYEAEQVQRLFGRGEFAAAALRAPVGQWTGPYRSSYGWHLLQVEARQEAREPVLAEVRDRVRTDFLLDAQARTNLAAFNDLAGQFKVVRAQL